MLLVHGQCQHHHLVGMMRRQHKALLGCGHVCQRPQQRAKPTHFDPQPRAIRLVRPLAAKGPRNQCVPRDVRGPRFAQRTGQRKQHWPTCQWHRRPRLAHHIAARIHDQCPGCEQHFHLLEQQNPLLAARDQARSGRVQDE